MAWWGWALGGVLAWIGVATVVAVVVGRSMRLCEECDRCTDCGHSRAAHQHYRAGTACALCPCRRLVAASELAVFRDSWHGRTVQGPTR